MSKLTPAQRIRLLELVEKIDSMPDDLCSVR